MLTSGEPFSLDKVIRFAQKIEFWEKAPDMRLVGAMKGLDISIHPATDYESPSFPTCEYETGWGVASISYGGKKLVTISAPELLAVYEMAREKNYREGIRRFNEAARIVDEVIEEHN